MHNPRKSTGTDILIGNRIRLRRQQLGWSQQQLANMIGISFQQVQKYEKAGNRITCGRLVDIAAALECSMLDLIGSTATGGTDPLQEYAALLTTPGATDLIRAYGTLTATGRDCLSKLANDLCASTHFRVEGDAA